MLSSGQTPSVNVPEKRIIKSHGKRMLRLQKALQQLVSTLLSTK